MGRKREDEQELLAFICCECHGRTMEVKIGPDGMYYHRGRCLETAIRRIRLQELLAEFDGPDKTLESGGDGD